MSLEERISNSLAHELVRLEAALPDLADVERRGRSLRRRGTAAVALAVAAVVTGVALVVPRVGDEGAVAPAPSHGTWQQLPDLPLAPRADSVTGWTGTEALVVGGYLTLCPSNASCTEDNEMARDGAAYNPKTNTWRNIADPPVAMANYFRSTMVGDTLVLFDGQRDWFAYDASADKWRTLPVPKQRVIDSGSLTSNGTNVYAISNPGPVLTLNVAGGRQWVVLPDSFLPGAEAQTVIATPYGFVLSGEWSDGSPGTIVAQAWTDSSSRQPIQTGQLVPYWHWTGERLVALDLQVAQNDDGTTTPYGGVLDPQTAEWSPLPNAPSAEESSDGWSPVAADGPLIAGWGYVYDDRDQSWTKLDHPNGAVADHGGPAVWAEGRLLVFGGTDGRTTPTAQAWAWSTD